LQRRICSVAAVAVATALLLAGCASAGSTSGSGSQSLVIGSSTTSQITSFADCTGFLMECQAVYETLGYLDSPSYNEGSVKPLLAKSWKWNTHRTVLSITLRQGVKFSDGEQMDAEAVKKSFDHEFTTEWKDIYFSDVKSVDVTGPYTLDVTLSAPDASFLTHLAAVPEIIAPKALKDTKKLATNPVGTGPYELTSTTTTDARFTRNPNYWNSKEYPFKNLEVKTYSDATARLNAVISGQVDFTEVDPTAANKAKSTAGLTVYPVGTVTPGLQIIDKNGVITPALKNLQVRKALEMAFDRAGMVQNVLNSWGQVTTQPYPEGTVQYNAAFEKEYSYDSAKAKQMIIDAGYPHGFTLKILTTTTDADWTPIIEQSLENSGVNATVVEVQSADFNTDVASKKYSVIYRPLAADSSEYVTEGSIFDSFEWTKNDPEISGLMAAYNADPTDSATLKAIWKYQFDNGLIISFARQDSTYAAKSDLKLNSTGQWYRQLFEIQPAA
jgi:peptide/nickel transport system substrate-binding protein